MQFLYQTFPKAILCLENCIPEGSRDVIKNSTNVS